ncbi:pyridoxal-phosphate dependent enzyme [bacterium]|nr:pyridoxal-phosphate dependent enzyme [bacterium]
MNQKEVPFLFKEFPDLKTKLPWIQLGEFPTPVHQLKNIGYENLWIKRDDLTSSIYGGNKVRKLEFALADAISKKKKKVVTLGAIGTNHGLATAIFCKKLGLDCTLLLFDQPVTKNVKQNMRLFHGYGAKMIYKETLGKTALSWGLTHRLLNPGAYFLTGGGSSSQGAIGFVNAVFELKSQVEQGLLPEPDCIFCPLGSSGTLAGLALGVKLAGMKTAITGVRVTQSHLGPIHIATRESVLKLMKNAYKILKRASGEIPDIDLSAPEIKHEFFGEGYGHVTAECSRAYDLLREKESINLDPTYTSKTFACVLDSCKKRSNSEETVLYWHTYNSVDLSAQAEAIDYKELPPEFHRFIEEPEENQC